MLYVLVLMIERSEAASQADTSMFKIRCLVFKIRSTLKK